MELFSPRIRLLSIPQQVEVHLTAAKREHCEKVHKQVSITTPAWKRPFSAWCPCLSLASAENHFYFIFILFLIVDFDQMVKTFETTVIRPNPTPQKARLVKLPTLLSSRLSPPLPSPLSPLPSPLSSLVSSLTACGVFYCCVVS